MKWRNIVRAIVAFAAVCCFIWLAWLTDARAIMRVFLESISGLGAWTPLFFILAYIVACLSFFPGIILTLGAGILFGVVRGTLLVATGATIGACCAFLISRYLARGWVERKFGTNPVFRAVDSAVEREGWKIVALIRLSPAFPFVIMNFILGLTRIPLSHFFVVTWLGIVPVTVLFVYFGSLIGDVAQLGNGPVVTGRMKWIIAAAGLAATVVVTTFVTRIVRRALDKELAQNNQTAAL